MNLEEEFTKLGIHHNPEPNSGQKVVTEENDSPGRKKHDFIFNKASFINDRKRRQIKFLNKPESQEMGGD
jgi:hypothetical protein